MTVSAVDTRPLTPLEIKSVYSKHPSQSVSEADMQLLMVSALEDHCKWWATERGGTPSQITDVIMGLVKECGKPPLVSKVEARRMSSKAFRRCLEERKPLGAQLSGYYNDSNIADELEAMESWLAFRTEQFHFGIHELDRAIGGGIMKGQTMSIIGNPGSMKTSLLLSGIETWIGESDEPVAFFSVDMDKASIFERLMLRELRCGPDVLRDLYAQGSPEYLSAKQAIGKRYSGRLNVFENSVGNKWTIEKIVEYVEINTPGLICVDFLTQLKKPRQSDFDVVNEVVPIFKDLAHSYGCAVVLLSQMSMASRKEQSSGGMGGAAKGGPTVEENVDIELELFRDISTDPDNLAPMIIATVKKTRRGVAGELSARLRRAEDAV